MGYSRRHFMVPSPVVGLCELERIDHERRTMKRRIRLAKFLVTKSPDTFDFIAMPSLNGENQTCRLSSGPVSSVRSD